MRSIAGLADDTTVMQRRKKRPLHWRDAALEAFPQQRALLTAPDEEFASYNFFFWLREQFDESISRRDTRGAMPFLDFALRSLRDEFRSDSEDIPVAAGVSFAEHLYDERSHKDWTLILSLMSRDDYLLCRRYLENWLDPGDFAQADEAADHYYA